VGVIRSRSLALYVCIVLYEHVYFNCYMSLRHWTDSVFVRTLSCILISNSQNALEYRMTAKVSKVVNSYIQHPYYEVIPRNPCVAPSTLCLNKRTHFVFACNFHVSTDFHNFWQTYTAKKFATKGL